tara:strand:- start:27 stop:782 length:756 start_codon:yes stop_codon:yes gene_type:complete
MKNITLIGSGNVATHLGLALKKNGFNIKQVYSKVLKNAEKLSLILEAEAINKLEKLTDSDLTILSVSDNAIETILKNIKDRPIVHTSGYTGINIFNKKFNNCGVIYPLQTLNKEVSLEFSETPLCIEANNPIFEKKITKLAYSISKHIIALDSEKRKSIHIAAVFASNFTNHMLSIAYDLLKEKNIDFSILLPLVNQSIKKIKNNNPKDVQTGPAKRKDINIINHHMHDIKNTRIKKMYKTITDSIIKASE